MICSHTQEEGCLRRMLVEDSGRDGHKKLASYYYVGVSFVVPVCIVSLLYPRVYVLTEQQITGTGAN